MNVQPFLFGSGWIEVRDGDDTVRAVFERHYSRKRYADGRRPKLFVGPGEKLVLVTPCARAIFAWRKFVSDNGQQGVNCAIFRNEGVGRSSDLVRLADAIADRRWPGERHYTYVDPREVAGTNPGYCFLMAGWRRCGVTKVHRLLILERLAEQQHAPDRGAAQGESDRDDGIHVRSSVEAGSIAENR